MEEPTASTLLCRLRILGAIPETALVVSTKGRADWVERGLLFRLALRKGPTGNVTWVLHVGDPLWGRPFHEGGILALVPIRWVDRAEGEGLWNWPADADDSEHVVGLLAPRVAAARAFVADRRDLCALLLSAGNVARGDLVADLHAGFAERMVRALLIARTGHEADIVAYVHNLLREPAADVPGDAPSSLLNQAHFWADQWSYQSGQHIDIDEALASVGAPAPGFDDAVDAPGAPRSGGASVGADPPVHERHIEDFWDRMG